MASSNGVIQWFDAQKEVKEANEIQHLIADREIIDRVRALRDHEKDEDTWVATAAAMLDDLDDRHRELDRAHMAALQQVKASRQEVIDEAMRLKILPTRIEEYRRNSLLLQRISAITNYASAASFLKGAPGVEEIGRRAYEIALEEGKRITAERKKERNGEPFDNNIARRMVPVLLRCEYTEGREYVQLYFLALHDSFARKVLQDVKEHLRKLFPPFADLVVDMQTKITIENIRDFLFAADGDYLIAVAKAHIWSNDRKRKYAVLLKRRPREDKIEVLDVASTGDGPDELSSDVGKVFRYRVYKAADGKSYPELRHVRDNSHLLYRFLLKVFRDSGWEVPMSWPSVRYPRHW